GPPGGGEAPPPQSEPITRARKVFAPQPAYPETARLRGDQGTVTVTGLVTESGTVQNARVLDGEGVSPEVNQAALEAFRTWQFLPAQRGGQPIETTYRVAFRFTLEAETPPPAPESPPPAPARELLPLSNGEGIEPPTRLATPLPRYPQSAWATGVTGDVVLEVEVDREGRVGEVTLLRGLPHGLSEAAIEAVVRWRFRPATRQGEPIAVRHRVTIRFAP
ncbi:MAG: energy transducer TonB, partial [Acidobacteriota bacterium]